VARIVEWYRLKNRLSDIPLEYRSTGFYNSVSFDNPESKEEAIPFIF
jgi:hypothetical protein